VSNPVDVLRVPYAGLGIAPSHGIRNRHIARLVAAQ
jgi:hypothetical protein